MATITKGYTFSATEWVTAGKLHTLVDSATIASIANADVSNSAAIAYSKLNLTGAIKNVDITAAAGIPYSKLTLTDSITDNDIASASAITYANLSLANSILNADINASAAIVYSKLSLTNSLLNADINASADIGLAKMASGASASIPITDAAGEQVYQIISGDLLINASGVGAIATGVIINTDINASADIALSKLVSAASGSTLIAAANGEFSAVAITGDVAVGADGTSTAVSATTTSKGISELATIAEVNTGTDAGRVVSPDALSGSYAGRKIVEIVPFERTTSITSGDGKADLVIPPALNGMNLVYVNAAVLTAGSSGSTVVMLYNVTDGADMLSTGATIASGTTGFGVSGAIATAADDVATGDLLRLDLDSVCTTAEKGLLVTLEFSLP
jgi:hypothetical protein